MALQDVINGPLGVSLAFCLAQTMPPRMGHWLADRLSDGFTRLEKHQARAVRANQWVVGGGRLSAAELQHITRATFRATGRCLYHYYHNLNRDQAVLALVEFTPAFECCIEQSREGRKGQLLVVPHISNFDLVGRAAAMKGIRMQVLSYPQPQLGYRLQNRFRNLADMEITPISNSSLRQAVDRLKSGGTVLTGVDRPSSESNSHPVFFRRPSSLPVGYVRLALTAGAPVLVISIQTLPDGRYQVGVSHPISMRPYDDRFVEATRNAEAVLEVIEPLIRQAPEQWSMFYPVWPEALHEIPN